MKRLEKIISQMLKAEKKKPREKTCPDEEHLASYVDGLLDSKIRKAVEEHLVGCDLCLEQVMLCSEIKKEQSSIDFKTRTVDIVLSFLNNTVEVIKRAAEITVLPPPVPAIVRGRRVITPNTVKFTREFKDMVVEVEVERLDEEIGEIRVWVIRDDFYVDNIRVSLLHNGRELASFLTEGGIVKFENVKFRKYKIRLNKKKSYIGEISLKLKEG
jgi:hypothetical protein